jgi:hypothetical protein
MLEKHHITRRELAKIAWTLGQQGAIVVTNKKPLERTTKDHHVLRVPST